MTGVAREIDICTGHATYPPRLPIVGTGAQTVLVNGIPCLKVGSGYNSHTNTVPPADSHSGFVITGSTTVFVEGSPIARIGDKIGENAPPSVPTLCFSTIALGSIDVIAGG